ncbi:MAG: nitroreductase family deazaflavin-dependent oxidoreductase [Segniliparus sp.]|uniref:nitroreductase family deazaflavin-dependent oxidoreductase n=1 Tax=Segniliparus sp. TaxID=2804064 RepID=UPI003F2AD695
MSEQESQGNLYEAPAEAINGFNAGVIENFRANDGLVTEGPFTGPTVLLHTLGAKSGEPRTNPLFYFDHEGRWYVVGSFGGAPKSPAWVHNLRANPSAKAELRVDGKVQSYDVVARELPEQDRDAVWGALIAVAPGFADYQANTDRVIPLFELVR